MKRCNRTLFTFLFVSLCWASSATLAGKLDDFESGSSSPSGGDAFSGGDDSDSGFFDALFDLFFDISAAGGLYCKIRDNMAPERNKVGIMQPGLRETGDPLLPTLRLDGHMQNVRGDVVSYQGRIEVGRGPVGLQYKARTYVENNPEDRMYLNNLLAMYRMCFTNHFTLYYAFGNSQLLGNDTHHGTSFSIPMALSLSESWSVEVRPTYHFFDEVDIDEFDVMLLYRFHNNASWNVGYQELTSPGSTLVGYYSGISLHW